MLEVKFYSYLLSSASLLFLSHLNRALHISWEGGCNHIRSRCVKLSVPKEVRVEGQSSEELAAMCVWGGVEKVAASWGSGESETPRNTSVPNYWAEIWSLLMPRREKLELILLQVGGRLRKWLLVSGMIAEGLFSGKEGRNVPKLSAEQGNLFGLPKQSVLTVLANIVFIFN